MLLDPGMLLDMVLHPPFSGQADRQPGAVRARRRDSDGAVVQGEAVVPGLVEALAATFA